MIELLAVLVLSALLILFSTFVIMAVSRTHTQLTTDMRMSREVDAMSHLIERYVKDATSLKALNDSSSFEAIKEEETNQGRIVIARTVTIRDENGNKVLHIEETKRKASDQQVVERNSTNLPLRFCGDEGTSMDVSGNSVKLNIICQTPDRQAKHFFRLISIMP